MRRPLKRHSLQQSHLKRRLCWEIEPKNHLEHIMKDLIDNGKQLWQRARSKRHGNERPKPFGDIRVLWWSHLYYNILSQLLAYSRSAILVLSN